jgi:hypothetical protein
VIDFFLCGHPNTPENTVMNGNKHKGRCAICKQAKSKAAYHSVPKETRQLQSRMRRLPALLIKGRKHVAMLESEARRYGMVELFERGDNDLS